MPNIEEHPSVFGDTVSSLRSFTVIAGDTQSRSNKNTQAPSQADETDPFYFGSPGRTRNQLVADPVPSLIEMFCVNGTYRR